MMLPGVELARRRRVHHAHEVQARAPHDLSASQRPFVMTAMDESAIVARRRLEEKLGRFSPPPAPCSGSSSAVTVSSPLSNLILSEIRTDNRVSANDEILSIDITGDGDQKLSKCEIKKRRSSSGVAR